MVILLEEPPIDRTKCEYRPGRWLRRGDFVRISGGPVWRDAKGAAHRFGVSPGVYQMVEHNVDPQGTAYIIVAGKDGASVVVLLTMKESRLGIGGIENRPYRLRRKRAKKVWGVSVKNGRATGTKKKKGRKNGRKSANQRTNLRRRLPA